MSRINDEAEFEGHPGLQPIEEEDRDGSSRREDDDMERGFSITYEQKEKPRVLLYDPERAASEVRSAPRGDGDPRSGSQSQYVQKSGTRLSYSINADDGYDAYRPIITENNEVIEAKEQTD